MKYKRIICVLMCIVFILMSVIQVNALGLEDLALELIMGCYDIAHTSLGDLNDDIQSMSGDEFYEFYNDNTSFDSRFWRTIYRFEDAIKNGRVTNGLPGPGIKPQFGLDLSSPTEAELEMEDGHYNCMLLNQDILEMLDEQNVNAYNNDERYVTLDYLNISTSAGINTTALTVLNSGLPVADWGTRPIAGTSNYSLCYFLPSSMINTHLNSIFIYPGGKLPPALYIPNNVICYQNNVSLPSGFYIVLGSNLLIKTYWAYADYYMGAAYYNSGDTTSSLSFGIGINNSFSYNRNFFNTAHQIYSSGAIVGNMGDSIYPGWSCMDLYTDMCGFIIKTEDVTTFLPETVPYDDDGTVIVMINNDNGNVYYTNPTEINNLYNNNYITENAENVTNDYSSQTINDITNNYNSFLETQTTPGGELIVYDDTNLLAKLDNIILGLNNIYNTIVNFNFFNFDLSLPGSGDSDLEVFSDVPIYDDFKDCITDHISIVSDIENTIEGLTPSEDIVYDGSDLWTELVPSLPLEPDSTKVKAVFYHKIAPDLSWYTPYRVPVRDFFEAFVQAFGLLSCWIIFRRIFSV